LKKIVIWLMILIGKTFYTYIFLSL